MVWVPLGCEGKREDDEGAGECAVVWELDAFEDGPRNGDGPGTETCEGDDVVDRDDWLCWCLRTPRWSLSPLSEVPVDQLAADSLRPRCASGLRSRDGFGGTGGGDSGSQSLPLAARLAATLRAFLFCLRSSNWLRADSCNVSLVLNE